MGEGMSLEKGEGTHLTWGHERGMSPFEWPGSRNPGIRLWVKECPWKKVRGHTSLGVI
jgi:hypothetical protein